MAKNIFQAIGSSASSMVWLGFLYAGFLYVAVGALGVSEITSRYGDQAVYIFHVVGVLDEVRQQERGQVAKSERRLSESPLPICAPGWPRNSRFRRSSNA